MTWGETATAQVKGKKTTPKQSRCFALTSIDLLGASLITNNLLYNRLLQTCLRETL
jgi:hypothetical protein